MLVNYSVYARRTPRGARGVRMGMGADRARRTARAVRKSDRARAEDRTKEGDER